MSDTVDKVERKRVKKHRKKEKKAADNATVAASPLPLPEGNASNKRQHEQEAHDDGEREKKRLKKERRAAKKAAKKAAASTSQQQAQQEPQAAEQQLAALVVEQPHQPLPQQQEQPAQQQQENVIFDLHNATEEELLRILASAPSLDQPAQQPPVASTSAAIASPVIDPQLQDLTTTDKLKPKTKKKKKSAVSTATSGDIAIAGPSSLPLPAPIASASTSDSIIQQSEPKRGRKRGTVADYSHLTVDELFTTHWIDLKKINQLAAERGFEVKRGMYTKEEDVLIEKAIFDWEAKHNMTRDETINLIIHPPRNVAKSKKDEQSPKVDGFWTHVTSALYARPMRSVHRHVQALYNPLRRMGPWKPLELQALENGYSQYGPAWTKISEMVGRSALDVRTKWREMNPEISKKFPRRVGKKNAKKYPSKEQVDDSSAEDSDGSNLEDLLQDDETRSQRQPIEYSSHRKPASRELKKGGHNHNWGSWRDDINEGYDVYYADGNARGIATPADLGMSKLSTSPSSSSSTNSSVSFSTLAAKEDAAEQSPTEQQPAETPVEA